MEESHKTHRPHIKVGKDEEKKEYNNFYMSHHLESYEVKIIYIDILYHSKEKSFITSQIQKYTQSLQFRIQHIDSYFLII